MSGIGNLTGVLWDTGRGRVHQAGHVGADRDGRGGDRDDGGQGRGVGGEPQGQGRVAQQACAAARPPAHRWQNSSLLALVSHAVGAYTPVSDRHYHEQQPGNGRFASVGNF